PFRDVCEYVCRVLQCNAEFIPRDRADHCATGTPCTKLGVVVRAEGRKVTRNCALRRTDHYAKFFFASGVVVSARRQPYLQREQALLPTPVVTGLSSAPH